MAIIALLDARHPFTRTQKQIQNKNQLIVLLKLFFVVPATHQRGKLLYKYIYDSSDTNVIYYCWQR